MTPFVAAGGRVTTPRPQAQRSRKGFVHRLLAEIKISEQADQSCQDSCRIHAIREWSNSRICSVEGSDMTTTLANQLPRINLATAESMQRAQCTLSGERRLGCPEVGFRKMNWKSMLAIIRVADNLETVHLWGTLCQVNQIITSVFQKPSGYSRRNRLIQGHPDLPLRTFRKHVFLERSPLFLFSSRIRSPSLSDHL
jgi:hypothetical protein